MDLEGAVQAQAGDQDYNVRRPLYGIEVKDPRPAYMQVYQADVDSTAPVSLVDSSAPGGLGLSNHNFILQAVSESRQEKVQIIETFGDHFVFFYGEKPIVLAVQGMLLNTADFNWKNEFLRNYESKLRGTKCVENRTRVFLGWDDVLAQGYILNCQVTYTADQPYLVPFAFQMLLSKPPLDLSENSSDYVTKAEDARVLESDTSKAVEYIGAIQQDITFEIDVNGDVAASSNATSNVPQSIDSARSATWISGKDPRKQQWKSADQALMDLNTNLVAQEAGSDPVTSRLALAQNPSSFPLASRTDSVVAISQALSTGISNSAVSIPSAPALG